ncbi:MAG: LytTR family DNA-binding domain-containing protein [Ruminococcus sp.]|nr:LytTR family DNA-binding domain-containing protein [Ruminococcus sp.]
MRIAICDDEKTIHGQLISLLHEYSIKRHIDIFTDRFRNGADLLNASKDYEVIFMDYQMNGLNGIETSRIIRQENKECIIIFVSAYPEAAVDSYEVGTFRFLVKPIDKLKLFKALDDYVRSIDYDNLLILKTHECTWKIKMSDIIYAEANGKKTNIRTITKSFEVHMHLKKIEEKLPPEKFIRCQRAYVVGFKHIKNHTNTEIIFNNGEKAMIGKSYFSAFKNGFQHYIMRYNERLI